MDKFPFEYKPVCLSKYYVLHGKRSRQYASRGSEGSASNAASMVADQSPELLDMGPRNLNCAAITGGPSLIVIGIGNPLAIRLAVKCAPIVSKEVGGFDVIPNSLG